MISFVLGRSKSGKSCWVESVLERSGQDLTYVGTLPLAPEYSETIEQHRFRRSAQWSTVDLTADVERDLNILHDVLLQAKDTLVDGLTFYLLQNCYRQGRANVYQFFEMSSNLLSCASASRARIVIVDSPISPWLQRSERVLLISIHKNISYVATERWIFQGGNASATSVQEMLRFSCSALPEYRALEQIDFGGSRGR